MFQGKGQYICSSDMLWLKDNLSWPHTLVYMQHMDLQSTQVYTGRQLHYFFEYRVHLIHKETGYKDLSVLLQEEVLKK